MFGDATMRAARGERCRFAARPRAVVVGCQVDVTLRGTDMTVNPVWRCAQHEVVDRGVRQASPLFSDHAPREVYLWQ
jgi:hypothetical protein